MTASRILGPLLAASLAVTGGIATAQTATPNVERRETGNDLSRVIAGVAALALLGAVIKQSRDEDKADAARAGEADRLAREQLARDLNDGVRRLEDVEGEAGRANGWRRPDHPGRGHAFGREDRRDDTGTYDMRLAAPIPADCLFEVRTETALVPLFGQRCLELNYPDIDRLPTACEVVVPGLRNLQRGHDPSCLYERGYLVARRS